MVAICRLCASLKKSQTMTFIGNESNDLYTKLEKCCQLDVKVKNGLPRSVCQDCVNKLDASFDFYRKVHESQQALEKLLNMKTRIKTKTFEKISTENMHWEEQKSVNMLTSISYIGEDGQSFDIKDQITEITDSNLTSSAAMIKGDYEHGNEVDKSINSHKSILHHTEPLNSKILSEDKDMLAMNAAESILRNDCNHKMDFEYKEVEVEDDPVLDSDDYEIFELDESSQNQLDQTKAVCGRQTAFLRAEKLILEENTDCVDTNTKHVNNSSWLSYPWKCIHCSVVFCSASELHKHYEQINVKMPIWTCADCHKVFPRYYSLINHVRQNHRRLLALRCDECDENFESFSEINNHRQSMHSRTLFKLMMCTICGKSFNSINSLQTHCKCHLPNDMRSRFSCDLCHKKFRSSSNLKSHQKIHAGMKDFVCDHCGKKFVQRANLEEHLLTHTEFTPYECDFCQKVFKTSERLSKHKKCHTDEKPFLCDSTDCNKTFRTKDALNSHYRIHTGEMPFKCEFCQKPFRFRSTLMTHHNTHTGIRPYSCEDCNHQFTNWPNYNKHMKRRHGIDLSSKNPRGSKPKKKFSTNMIIFENDTTSDVDKESSKLVDIRYERFNGEEDNEDEDVKEIMADDFGTEYLS